MNSNNLITMSYKVSSSPDVINKLYGVTPEIEEKLAEMSVKVQKKKNSAVKELNGLIIQYPFVPQFKNFLSTLYEMQGNHFMATEINRRIVSLHSGYLYTKLIQATIAIHEKEFEKVPEILGDAMELKSLYPERNEFHSGEVSGFYITAFKYFIAIKDAEQAQMRLNIIEKLNKEFQLRLNIFDLNRQIMVVNLEKSMKGQAEEWAEIRTPEVIAKTIALSSTDAPHFTHDIINELYHNDLNIDQQIISKILSLPRETLLEDLHKVVYDSISRFDVFVGKDIEWNPKTHEFLMHAVLLLVELKDESSLEILLDILRQDNNYLEVWFSDFLTDGFWELIYPLAHNKLDVLKNFLLEPNNYTFSRSAVSDVLMQMSLYQPEKRTEITAYYKEIFEEWIQRKDDDTIIDTEVIAFLVSDAVDLKMKELIPQITELFTNGLVAKGVSGNLEKSLQRINEVSKYNQKRKVFNSITERYNYFLSSWIGYKNENEHEDYKFLENKAKDDATDRMQTANNQSIINTKIGRNDPCPCGSGKKYKKCCGNN